MVDYVGTQGCRMAYLRAQLNDPELAPGWRCGRCDQCGGMELPEAPDAEAIAAARAEMDRPGVEVETRKMWPTGLASIGLEVLGLGPFESPTLGMTIYWVDYNAAIINGWWWWWVPPIVVIAILFTGLFLVAVGLDEIANPRLRNRI